MSRTASAILLGPSLLAASATALLLALATLLAFASPAFAQYANRTIMYWDSGHGTQVEYYDANGGTWLWYPGNRIALPGRWKTEGKDICFIYGPNTYNPVTGSRGAVWECQSMAVQQSAIVEKVKGDVFGLSDGTIPFVLKPGRTSIAALQGGKQTPSSSGADGGGAAATAGLPSADELCKQWLAGENGSPSQMLDAGLAYFHGKALGKPCVKVDYIKAMDLVKRSGNKRTYESLMKSLREKASTGNPKAVAALARLGG